MTYKYGVIVQDLFKIRFLAILIKITSMSKTALLGDSSVKGLCIICDGFLGKCRFYGVGGMRADGVNQRVLSELMVFHPETVFVCVLVETTSVLIPVQDRLSRISSK